VLRYNLGCGAHRLNGWVNVDIADGADWKFDLGAIPWPIDTSTSDEVLASHILEHFPKMEGIAFLRECYRILKTDGVLHVAVPDMDKFILCKLNGDWSPIGDYFWRDLNHLLGGDERERNLHQRHQYMYNFETLAYILENIGFEVSRRTKPLNIDTAEYRAISLYLDAVKIS
jgi:predicted SAM-dependent methyltransferase